MSCGRSAGWYSTAAVTSPSTVARPPMASPDTPARVPSEHQRSPSDLVRARRFATIFDTEHDTVWRTLRRFGVADASVDDATQRVFLVAARRLDEIRVGDERRFLYGVAMRVASEVRRRDPARHFSSDDELLEALPDDARDAEDLLIEHAARAALDKTLDDMPEDLRQVFVLVELEGIAVSDLALLFGVPAGTAASRLRRAREAFAQSARRVRARLERGRR